MPDQSPLAPTEPIIDALVQLSYVVNDALNRTTSEYAVSATQLRLLGMLRDRTPSMASIAARLNLDRSSVTGLIDRAERRGLVVRRSWPDDARVTVVELTDAGARLTSTLAEAVTVHLEPLVRNVPASDRAHLVRIAELITDH
jgi:DNA-binding MarR family transcriptional regulator